MPDILPRLRQVLARIDAALAACGRGPDAAALVAVTKARPAADIRSVADGGVMRIGESYIQEALPKIATLADLPLEWHFIGPIQANKTRAIAEHFHWVHSLDRARIAERLSEQRPAHLPALQVCLQVNLSGEPTKGGVSEADLPALAAVVASLPHLHLRGLMAIPAPTDDPARQRAAFAAVRHCLERLNAQGYALDTLSMGMSGDLEAAIAEGATLVRVGSDIFGARQTARTAIR